jgi:hypothetical protein
MDEKDLSLSRNVLEFVTIAGEYCKLLENIEPQNRQEHISSLQRFLPLLYFRGTLLPDIQPSDPDSTERYVTQEQWENIFNNLRDFFAETDVFLLPESWIEQSESTKTSISEFLTDAYQDLMDFILLYKKPHFTARENAIYEIKHLFESNWGKKLSILIPVLHQITSPEKDHALIDDDF